jgi:hypothetical protein
VLYQLEEARGMQELDVEFPLVCTQLVELDELF